MSRTLGARAACVRILHRLHFYAGILIAPFLLVAAITGALYAIAPTAENAIYRDQLHTNSTGTPAALADQVLAAERTRPDLQVSAVRPAPEAGDTTQVIFTDPSLGESERRAVFVDPVTLETLGDLTVYGSSNALPMREWLSTLHRNLHLGETGRLYSEMAASWLWVIVLAGLVLWFTRTVSTRRRTITARNRTVRRHGLIGVWLAAGLLFLSATGLTWSTYAGESVAKLRSELSWNTPTTNSTLPGAEAPAASGSHGDHGGGPAPAGDTTDAVAQIDAAVAIARSAGLGSKIEIKLPANKTSAFVISEVRAAWQFSPDTVAVDPRTNSVTSENRFADWPLAAQATTLAIALHMGILFGIVNQLVLLALALGLVALIVLGYRAWWQRARARSRLPVGSAPPGGGLKSAPLWLSALFTGAAIAIGWYVPLLGWPLLAFIVIDVVANRWTDYRKARSSAESTSTEASQPMHLSVTDSP